MCTVTQWHLAGENKKYFIRGNNSEDLPVEMKVQWVNNVSLCGCATEMVYIPERRLEEQHKPYCYDNTTPYAFVIALCIYLKICLPAPKALTQHAPISSRQTFFSLRHRCLASVRSDKTPDRAMKGWWGSLTDHFGYRRAKPYGKKMNHQGVRLDPCVREGRMGMFQSEPSVS